MPNRFTLRILTGTASALLALSGVTACTTGPDTDPNRVNVVAAFYPLQFITDRIGGDSVRVSTLAKPGAEPHDLELNPGQVGQISTAELIVYLQGFQPAVDDAVAQEGRGRAFDVTSVQPLRSRTADGHSHDGHADGQQSGAGGLDPHVWLDPTRLATIGDHLADRLGQIDPDRAADYTARAGTLRADLEALDQEYHQGLQTCQRRQIVVSHAAFGYLTERYGLEQIGVHGLSPDTEPAAQRLAEVIEEARRHGATTIFFETLVSPKVAETIAKEVGARTAVLDPLEGLKPGDPGDYFTVMRANLTALRPALECS